VFHKEASNITFLGTDCESFTGILFDGFYSLCERSIASFAAVLL
jgi:hypothetical protein